MITSPIKAIVITGHYAAGKGDVAIELLPRIESNFPLFTCTPQTDREFLNAAVLRDVYDRSAIRPGVEGPHSIIRDLGPPLVFDVKDGTLHRDAHTNMVASIPDTPRHELRILEIATGPDVPSFGLAQSGAHLVSLLSNFGVIDHTLVIDVYAPFSVRKERNAGRLDRVSDEIMNVAAIDDGGLAEVRHLLGGHYFQLDNSEDGQLLQQVSLVFESFIRSNLETTARLLERNTWHTGWFR